MGDNKGIDDFLDSMEGTSSWFMTEAECDNLDCLDSLFDSSTEDESFVSQLIDDDPLEQGNSLSLFNEQITEQANATVIALKRKLIQSPQSCVSAELSPRLAAVSISPRRKSKRRLFDSGIEEDEATDSSEKVALDELEKENADKDNVDTVIVSPAADIPVDEVDNVCNGTVNRIESPAADITVLRSSNRQAKLYGKFKEVYGVSFSDLTRAFKSDKTCSKHWCIFVYRAVDEVLEASKELLKQYCDYIQTIHINASGLYLLEFNTIKNRSTVEKLICKILNVQACMLLCDPPRIRSSPVALYFYKKTLSNVCTTYGTMPDWMASLTMLTHSFAASAESFDLSAMIQWAYDSNLTSEPAIAYGYAQLANQDPNAAAFLKSNCQVKYVKDCCAMVRYYKRQEMAEMSMGEWIAKCCFDCTEEGDWRVIADLLRYQGVNILTFLTCLKSFFKGIPKKQCILIYGPPDTGKSYFCNSLIRFMKGRVISFMNRQSHFWLQPLIESKIGFLDDATMECWYYMDVNMRNAMDGNEISIDAKHKAPMQIKLPPLLITSNVDLLAEPSLQYLHSRVKCFKFPNKLPLDSNDNVVYNINDASWKYFFRKLAVHLDLAEVLDNGCEKTDRTVRFTARANTDTD